MIASAAATVLAYLIGSIPFGFLIFYQVRGVDIRTIGSGNIGATNVGRNLGFRYFVLVFILDMLKGLLPTLYLPRAVSVVAGSVPADLSVFVALAAILGHNFPIYLKFKGGKGVATSLGAVLALDPSATVAAILGFVVGLSVTSYVSLASIMGGLTFAAAHFLMNQNPWSVQHRGVSILTIALLILLVGRHRKNIVRIIQGTEPKVMLKRPKT
jgi:glycerol-3-phosphate acyltransferase PlsY